MEGQFPKRLRKINVREEKVKSRFLKATLGWIKYKPLLLYISDKESYHAKIAEMRENLKETVPKLNKVFADECFSELIKELEIYDRDVEKHYEEYKRTNEIWKSLRGIIFE